MRRAWGFVCVLVLFLTPAAASASLHPDEPGDVAVAGADVRFVSVTRSEEDLRVTIGYGGELPSALEITLVLQLTPEPEGVMALTVVRDAEGSPGRAQLTLGPAASTLEVGEPRAQFSADAVQFSLASKELAHAPCATLRSLLSVHVAADGVRHEDAMAPSGECAGAPLPTESAFADAVLGRAAEESAYEPPSEARVPGAGVALVASACMVAAFAGRLRTRR